MNDIRGICLRLLVHLAVRCGPGEVVLEAVAKKVEADNFERHADVDAISELEVHLSSIVASLDAKAVNSTDFVTEGVNARPASEGEEGSCLQLPSPSIVPANLVFGHKFLAQIHVAPERKEQVAGPSEGEEAVDGPRNTADPPPDGEMESQASPDTPEGAHEQTAARA
ncbi:hypothetical protein BBJ28_00003163 [Nothophytophthora sp. Chile5]|nr:hypothetical protein BBJ28_00003163 [Nothophytophthora sp. Chile5]